METTKRVMTAEEYKRLVDDLAKKILEVRSRVPVDPYTKELTDAGVYPKKGEPHNKRARSHSPSPPPPTARRRSPSPKRKRSASPSRDRRQPPNLRNTRWVMFDGKPVVYSPSTGKPEFKPPKSLKEQRILQSTQQGRR